ncbi:hypothetical protein M413DRAFT_249433 [Hebeloma cylindrosporum]|uniref:Ammonium transporter AmtB-like domain-containing protein n=1 Tax=Hebeloma cylindrosporum TaxID=76867 RepID=A0A0C3C144_HEBCY|nr:hypothetical protein M413DRAFT_249433 [Hebeloma cylindrosporum h7]
MVNITQSYAAIIWNDSKPVGGTYNLGNSSFILNCVALVFLMSPGVGILYSGLLRRKNALSALYLSMAAVAVVSIQWFIMGFSLTFSEEGTSFIGNFKYACLRNTPMNRPAEIPFSLFYIYEAMFAALSSVIAIGAFAGRGRPGPILVFVAIWTTLVYDPIAHSIWSKMGWANRLGVLDFAGGTSVHISSGSAALAISIYLGRRTRGDTKARMHEASNPTNVVLGTVLLTFGWFGLNGGSAMSPDIIAIQACINSNLSAAAGALTAVVLNYRTRRRWSPVGFCSGAIAGLVTITPGSGYVTPPAAFLYGVVGATLYCLSARLFAYVGIDDSLDIFATHGVGGLFGSILTGVFAQESLGLLFYSPSTSGSGWVTRNWKQVGYQAASAGASLARSWHLERSSGC